MLSISLVVTAAGLQGFRCRLLAINVGTNKIPLHPSIVTEVKSKNPNTLVLIFTHNHMQCESLCVCVCVNIDLIFLCVYLFELHVQISRR